MLDVRGKRVLVLGLGVNQGGVGVARYLAGCGAQVRVTDLQDEGRLTAALDQLAGLDIGYTLGRHDPEDIKWADIVVRNPGVPRESPWLAMAREAGARVEMEMTLFFRACPAPIIGVTGTKGKTTTTTMVATLLRERWPETVVAGNMGRSALLELDQISGDTPVVIELSSFQIEALDEHRLSPHVAVITNVGEDHLDRYASFEEYAGVKAALARHQQAGDWLVYNRDDPTLPRLLQDVPGQVATFGREPVDRDCALWIEADRFAGRWKGEAVDLGPTGALQLPGEHSRLNLLAAMGASLAFGASPADLRRAVPGLQPVPDRLETVGVIDGVEYINDTTATVPAAAKAALQAFSDRRVIAIAGGSEKHLDLAPLADALVQYASAIVLLDGEATARLMGLLEERRATPVEGPCGGMAEAVKRAAGLAGSGDVVLLSPGCASFGMFRNEFDRGEQFRRAVRALAAGEEWPR